MKSDSYSNEDSRREDMAQIPWKTVRFGDLILGKPRHGLYKGPEFFGEGVKIIKMGPQMELDRITSMEISDRVRLTKSELSRFQVLQNDLLFLRTSLVMKGTGKCSIVTMCEEPMVFVSNLIAVTLVESADPEFYYYFFKSQLGRQTILSIVEQTAAATLRSSDLIELKVPSAPLLSQRSVSKILSDLDSKIELNKQMNKTLESIAQAIFKSWFVDFDPVRAKMAREPPESICKRLKLTPEILDMFPNRLVVSELGEIPEGWEVKSLGELVNIIRGRSYESKDLRESETALVTLKSFERGGGYRFDGLKPYTGTYKPEQLLHSGDILIATTDLTQEAAVIGRPITIRGNTRYHNLVASLDTIIVRPVNSSLNRIYLYYLCATNLFVSHTSTYVTGTTVLHLSKEAISSFRFALPTHNIVDIFQRNVSLLLKRNEVIETENEHITSIRDTLLPKLMSGKIRVPVGDANE